MAREIKNLLVNRIHDRELRTFAERYARGRLLDIGCGTKPYEQMFRPYVTEHVGVDHAQTPHANARIDLLGSAYSIPAHDASFDSALCTAVLEHLEEPEQAIRECYRLLRPGGVAIYSIPFIWHLHEEPRDFFRYSKYGIAHLFGKAGFTLLEVKPLSGFAVTFGQLLVYNLYRYNVGPLRWFGIIHALGGAIQAAAYVIHRIHRSEQWTWMYMVAARKGEDPADG